MARFSSQAFILLVSSALVGKLVCTQIHANDQGAQGLGDSSREAETGKEIEEVEKLSTAEAVQDASTRSSEGAQKKFQISEVGKRFCKKCSHVTELQYKMRDCKHGDFWGDLSSKIEITSGRRRNSGADAGTNCVAPHLNPHPDIRVPILWGLVENKEHSYPGACKCMDQFESECNKAKYRGQRGECMRRQLCGCRHVCNDFKQLLGCSGKLLEIAENVSAIGRTTISASSEDSVRDNQRWARRSKAKPLEKQSSVLMRADVSPEGSMDVETQQVLEQQADIGGNASELAERASEGDWAAAKAQSLDHTTADKCQ